MTDTGQHEPSAAERQQLHGPPPAADPTDQAPPEPEAAEPGPCKECGRRGDTVLALVGLGVAVVIAVMAVDLLLDGQLSALVFGRADGSE